MLINMYVCYYTWRLFGLNRCPFNKIKSLLTTRHVVWGYCFFMNLSNAS